MNLHDYDLTTRAEEAGALKKAIEAAKNLLRMGVGTLEQIAQAQGLPLEKVQELAEEVAAEKKEEPVLA